MSKQILIRCGESWFEFTKSRTGQLDFLGKVEGTAPDVSGWQEISGSTYFSPSFYVFISDKMNMTPLVYVADGVEISDCDVYDYLLHVGALLCAVDSKDSLLAGELYLRRRETFERFAPLTQYIYGRIQRGNSFFALFRSDAECESFRNTTRVQFCARKAWFRPKP